MPPATDRTRPGYTADPEVEKAVTELLASMSLENKVEQLFGVHNPPSHSVEAFEDLSRSLDTVVGNGKTVRGFRYRAGGRGVNLRDGQPDRPSQDKNYSTAFPAQSARAASWNVELELRVGRALGEETMVSRNTVLHAPTMNIVRHPFWGGTQKTYGEDMFHVGRMASALTAGIQEHVVACANAFAANNIENNRDKQDALLDEQTLREIYGRHFEMVVREGGVGCIMAAINAVNGKKSTQNKHLLTDILRSDFGFRGFVVSDFAGMPGGLGTPSIENAREVALEALQAGFDVELPIGLHYEKLAELVAGQQLTEADIDASARRVLEQKFRFGNQYVDGPFGLGTTTTLLSGDSIINNDAHLALAEEAAIESAVLLTNGPQNSPLLPIRGVQSIAVVGLDRAVKVSSETTPPTSGTTLHFATDVNLGDRGAAKVNVEPAKSVSPFAGIKAAAGVHGISVTSGNSVAAATNADFIVVVVGLMASDEGDNFATPNGGDRKSLDLPDNQAAFVSQLLDLGKPTAIVIESGSIVNLPWLSHANQRQATIWTGYSGQRGGAALGKLLLGDANFSGKMPLAWPQAADLPPFTDDQYRTKMGYFFGYRDYDDRKAKGSPVELVFPFGHGLSYTNFTYSGLSIPCGRATANDTIDVTLDVANVGDVDGSEVVMLFVKGPPRPPAFKGNRPVKELKGFHKLPLEASGSAGSTQRISIPLRVRDLRHWEGDENGQWVLDSGTYTILVGPSGDDAALTLKGAITIDG